MLFRGIGLRRRAFTFSLILAYLAAAFSFGVKAGLGRLRLFLVNLKEKKLTARNWS